MKSTKALLVLGVWLGCLCSGFANDFSIEEVPTEESAFDSLSKVEVEDFVQGQVLSRTFGDALADKLMPLDARLGDTPLLGCTAGDIGQFITVMSAFELVNGNMFSPDDVEDFFKSHLKLSSKSLTMLVDAESLSHLCSRAGVMCPAATSTADSNSKFEEIKNWIVSPPDHAKASIEMYFGEAQSQVGAIKDIVQHSGQYLVRAGLVQAVLTGFLHLLWSGEATSRVSLQFLPIDDLLPQALLRVRASSQCPSFYGLAVRTQGYALDRLVHVAVQHPDACRAYGSLLVAHANAFLSRQDDVKPSGVTVGPFPQASGKEYLTSQELLDAATEESGGSKQDSIEQVAVLLSQQQDLVFVSHRPAGHVFELTFSQLMCPVQPQQQHQQQPYNNLEQQQWAARMQVPVSTQALYPHVY